MKKVLIMFFGSMSFFVNGQSGTYNKIPLTPNATSLGEYTTVPVGLYSGTAQYSIPIYTLQGMNLSVPVTLNYSTNGIKVEDFSSWVGAGWSLDAGGVITREVKHKPDDYTNDFIPYIDPTCLTIDISKKIEDMTNDLEYDRFSFNFMGNSGSFIIVDGEVKLIENNGLKFDTVHLSLNEFVITDNGGIKYYFGKSYDGSPHPIEQTQIGENGLMIKTAWYLSKIVHWSGEKINFVYTNSGFQPTYSIGFSQNRTKQIPTESPCAICPSQTDVWSPVSNIMSSTFRHNNIYLESIHCSDLYDQVTFTRSGNKLTTINGKTKKIKLNIITPTDYRHYLKEVSFQSLNLVDEKKYKFEYYDESNVPQRETLKRDYWGYYNGYNNQDLINGNHNPNPSEVKNGVLKKITFPTGGYSIIDYECNSVTSIGCTNQIELPTDNSWHFGGMNSSEEFFEPYEFTIPNEQDVTFTLMQEYYPNPSPMINGNNEGSAQFSLFYPNGQVHHFPQPNFDNGIRELTLHLVPGTYSFGLTVESDIYRALYKFTICNQIGNVTQNFGGVRVKKTDSYASNGNLSMSKGYDYKSPQMASPQRFSTHYDMNVQSICIQQFPDANETPPEYQPYCMKWVESSTGPLKNIGAAGNAFYGEVTENFIEGTNNKYSISHTFNDAPYKSPPYAILTSDLPENTVTEYFGNPYEIETNYYKITDSNQKFLIKKQEYQFSNSFENLDPFYPSYIKVVKTIGRNAYDGPFLPGVSCITDFVIFETKMRLARYSYMRFWQKLNSKIEVDYIYNDSNSLVGKIENQSNFYYENVAHRQITRQENITSETLNDGLTNKIETIKYSYPDDIINTNSLYGGTISLDNFLAISKMKSNDKHMINYPLQIEKLNNEGNHLETKRYLYKLQTFANFPLPFPLLEKEQFLKGDVSTSNMIEDNQLFSHYNPYNMKPQQILANNNDSPTCYIYGYNNRYPIAIIQNKYYDSVMGGIVSGYSNEWSYSNFEIQNLYSQLNSIPNILFTVYEHRPLIGVSAIIDTKGEKTTYEYDVFNRLKEVKDAQGNILTENEYNYRP